MILRTDCYSRSFEVDVKIVVNAANQKSKLKANADFRLTQLSDVCSCSCYGFSLLGLFHSIYELCAPNVFLCRLLNLIDDDT